jgi:hypothetical protein
MYPKAAWFDPQRHQRFQGVSTMRCYQPSLKQAAERDGGLLRIGL